MLLDIWSSSEFVFASARASRCSPARARPAGAACASLEISRATYPDFRRRGGSEDGDLVYLPLSADDRLKEKMKRLRGSLGKEIGEVPSLGKF